MKLPTPERCSPNDFEPGNPPITGLNFDEIEETFCTEEWFEISHGILFFCCSDRWDEEQCVLIISSVFTKECYEFKM